MSQITSFDRTTCRLVQDQVLGQLKTLLEPLGLHVKLLPGNFTPSSLICRVEIATTNADGEAATREADSFKMYASLYGLSPDDFGREFRDRTKTFTICGLAAKSRAYPILAKDQGGKVFKFPVEQVKRLLGPDARQSPDHK